MPQSKNHIDTTEALQALVDAIGDGLKHTALVFGINHRDLRRMLNNPDAWPTVATLNRWSTKALDTAGIGLDITVPAVGALQYDVVRKPLENVG